MKSTFKTIPIIQVERDPNQPRKDFGTEGEENRLLRSIKDYGIQDPLKVSLVEEGRYIILDGHRRYICAQKLGLKAVPCMVYPKMNVGEFESRRFEVQNNRRKWKPLERSEALERIKTAMGFKTNKELAKHLHLAETAVANSLQLRKQKLDYLEMMWKHNLSESYQIEFVRLKPKIRKIKEFEADDIAKILFEKVQHKVIRNSKSFRRLGRIFLRATANENEIYNFLSNPDMTIGELEQRALQSGFSLLIEQLIGKITDKLRSAVALSSQEKTFLGHLRTLIDKVI